MEQLALTFRDGSVDGRGVDVIGPFIFRGEHDEHGHVVLIKHYVGGHQVLYRGSYDGEGTIIGTWSIGEHFQGPFALTPESFDVDEDAPVLQIKAEPPAASARGH